MQHFYSQFLTATFDLKSFFIMGFFRATNFFYSWAVLVRYSSSVVVDYIDSNTCLCSKWLILHSLFAQFKVLYHSGITISPKFSHLSSSPIISIFFVKPNMYIIELLVGKIKNLVYHKVCFIVLKRVLYPLLHSLTWQIFILFFSMFCLQPTIDAIVTHMLIIFMIFPRPFHLH